MRLTKRTLGLLLDPLVQTTQVIVMHALDFCHLMAVLESVEADGAVLVA